MDILINLIVVIMLQCTCILNHKVGCLKYIQVIFVNTSMKLKKVVIEKFQQFELPSSKNDSFVINRYYISHCIILIL